MAHRHLHPRELRAPACTAPRRTACREPRAALRLRLSPPGRKCPLTLPDVLVRQLARHGGGPASGAEGAALPSEWPRGGGVRLRRRPEGARRAGNGEGGAPGACPSEGSGPRPPRRAPPPAARGRGELEGRWAAERGGFGAAVGRRRGCCVEGCGGRSGFPLRDGGEGHVSLICVRE